MPSQLPLAPSALLFLALLAPVVDAAPRVLAPGALPDDVRLQAPKDLNGYFPFAPAASKAAWAPRADYVRRQILVSQGLWPMPTKTPLNVVSHGRIDRPGSRVQPQLGKRESLSPRPLFGQPPFQGRPRRQPPHQAQTDCGQPQQHGETSPPPR